MRRKKLGKMGEGQEQPPKGYDAEMIEDFLNQLLWEIRIHHFENTAAIGTVNPELASQLATYLKKRGCFICPNLGRALDVSEENGSIDEYRKCQQRLSETALERLEAALPIIQAALRVVGWIEEQKG